MKELIELALAEDIGQGDITSELTIPAGAQAELAFVARERMVVSGANIPDMVYGQLGGVRAVAKVKDGQKVEVGAVLAVARGDARVLLTGERTALNIMQRMSGVATLTQQYVDAVQGTKAIILDTRKTMPGMRALDKYAVTCGGGQNHRLRLDDMVLIKDNHIGLEKRGIGVLVDNVRKQLGGREVPIVVECDTLAQVKEALAAKPNRILLDNMTLDELREAVALSAGSVPLEASGGVSLSTVRDIALTGVDYISVGKITHSATAVDIGADIRFD